MEYINKVLGGIKMIAGTTIIDGNVTWKVVNDQTSSSSASMGGGDHSIF